MNERAATIRRRFAAGRAARSGRPPRALAGETEERILDAAKKVFLERGFEGASVDEIADVARAGLSAGEEAERSDRVFREYATLHHEHPCSERDARRELFWVAVLGIHRRAGPRRHPVP